MENLKFKKAKDAINELFADTSVSSYTTKEMLEDLFDEIKTLITILKEMDKNNENNNDS